MQVYEELLESAIWKRRKGKDFVFFIPYSISQVLEYERSLPGGGIMQEYLDFVCTKLRPALQLTVEQLQVNCCLCSSCKHLAGVEAVALGA